MKMELFHGHVQGLHKTLNMPILNDLDRRGYIDNAKLIAYPKLKRQKCIVTLFFITFPTPKDRGAIRYLNFTTT